MYVLEDKPGKISGYSIRCNQSFLIWCSCIILSYLQINNNENISLATCHII